MSITKAIDANDYDSTVLRTDLDLVGPARPLYADILTVGAEGTNIVGHFSDKVTITQQTINATSAYTVNITVTGAVVGNTTLVGVYPALPVGLIASGQVVSGNTVRVTVYNYTASPITLLAGSIRADVWQH